MEESKKRGLLQFIKFALVGASNTLVDIIISFVLTLFINGYLAKVIGYCCGVANSYFLNTAWTFKQERRRDAKELARFLLVNLGVLLISLALKWVFEGVLHLDVWYAQVLGEGWFTDITVKYFCTLLSTLVCIFINFFANKLFVFKSKDEDAGNNQ